MDNNISCNGFVLKKDDLSGIRYIKLDKKASYSENWKAINYEVEEEKRQKEKIDADSDRQKIFYSFGFYDLLTCYKASDLINYREHFHISPIFDKYRNTLKVEQWFGIFPVDQENTSTEAASEIVDPFFCGNDLEKALPFLGVILISLSNPSGDFKESLGTFVDNIKSQINAEDDQKPDVRFIYRLYYSLNCADLCFIIRTDSLNYVHKVNRTIERMAEGEGIEINTTVIFSVQDEVNKEDLNVLDSKNEKVSFIVRSDRKYEDYFEGKDAEKASAELSFNETTYGVNGTGKFVIKLNYKQYSELLPDLLSYKLNLEYVDSNEISPYIRSICHEREWFEEDTDSNIEKKDPQIPQEKICRWIYKVREKIQNIDNVADNLFTFLNRNYVYKKMFESEFRLVKDLVDTYSDLWYKNVSQSGYVFFAQIYIALNGIEKMLQEMQNIVVTDALEQSVKDLYKTIHSIACDLNGYNKQFQYLNQDSVNFPSYEIQSKVNSEKYMAAYSSFLHRFFAAYYQNKSNDEYIVQNFPLALIDITKRKIVANIFFSSLYKEKTKKENDKKRSLFSVHFPSAEYFANVWNSIPLLMHEIFHRLHYGKTEERNNAIVYSIDVYFAEIIVSKLLNIINDDVTINNSLLAEILKEPVYETIRKERTEFFDDDPPESYPLKRYSDWRFKEVISSCQEFYGKVFDTYDDGKNISYKQTSTFYNKIRKDVEHILQSIGFTEMCCAFSIAPDEIPKELYYAANTLYFCFNHDMYQNNQEKYNSFFERLNMDIDQAENDHQKQIFSFMACKCKMFVEKSKLPEKDKIEKNISQNDENNWYWLMEIILVAGMFSVYEKYQFRLFSDNKGKNWEENFRIYCKDIMPKLFYDNIVDYSEKLETVYQNSGLSEQNKRILKELFREYLELYRSVNNLVRSFSDEKLSEFRGMEDDTGEFMRDLHKKCKKHIRKLIKADESQFFKAVFSRTNREQLVKLGLLDERGGIFKEVYETLLSKVDAGFVKDIIADRASLFQEVYADCGMCTTIGFDFFGYCMFSLSNHNTVNDFTATNEEANFLADRIHAVAGMYFETKDNTDLEEAKGFLAKLFDKEMIQFIIQMLNYNEANEKLQELSSRLSCKEYSPNYVSLNKTKDVFLSVTKPVLNKWMDEIIVPLLTVLEDIQKDTMSERYQLGMDVQKDILQQKMFLAKTYLFNLYSVLEIFDKEDIFVNMANQRDPFNLYFYQLKDKITDKNNKEIAFVRGQKCIDEIRRFYNLDFSESEGNKFDEYYNLYRYGFVEQCNFIFDNYCEYKNAYCEITKRVEINREMEIEDWYDLIDNYYLGEEA